MKLIPLTEVGHVLHAGISLPWVVRDSKGVMLLARGYLLPDQRSVNAILSRGMYVDWEDVENAERPTRRQSIAQEQSMLDLWHRLQIHLALMLRSSTEQYFLQKVGESIAPIAALADSNVDLLIFLILRHDHVRLLKYGVVHALHCAFLCSLLSRRLGWSDSKRHSLIGAALTMNISMIELQGQLAQREGRPTADERQAIDDHPRASAEILRTAGLDDEEWLTTVEQHHEAPGGKAIRTSSASRPRCPNYCAWSTVSQQNTARAQVESPNLRSRRRANCSRKTEGIPWPGCSSRNWAFTPRECSSN